VTVETPDDPLYAVIVPLRGQFMSMYPDVPYVMSTGKAIRRSDHFT